MTRAEKVVEAQSLRTEGFKLREIGARMGVATSTVDSWINDPDLSKLRARKASYAPVCELCGGSMNGSAGPAGPRSGICMDCRRWSDEAIIEAVQRWATGHGGIPPTVQDWAHADTDHPNSRTVTTRIGWNEALLRAGFALRCDRRPETTPWIIEQVRAGVSTVEIARKLGTSPSNVHNRVRQTGVKVSELRRAA